MKLDLACGEFPKEGFDGVDIRILKNVEYECDLNHYPWYLAGNKRAFELKDNSVEELYSSHFVEHVYDLVAFMNEAYRVLQSNGVFTIRHPYQHSNRAWQDPTHVRALNEDSWFYYNKLWREQQGLSHYPITTDFEILDLQAVWNPEFAKKLNGLTQTQAVVLQATAFRHQVNVVDDLIVKMKAIK